MMPWPSVTPGGSGQPQAPTGGNRAPRSRTQERRSNSLQVQTIVLQLRNLSSAVLPGSIVQLSTSSNSFNTSVTQDDLDIIGVTIGAVGSSSVGPVAIRGWALVRVAAGTTAGQHLRQSTTAGVAEGTAAQTKGSFAFTLTARDAATGLAEAIINEYGRAYYEVQLHNTDAVAAHAASAVGFTPNGSIAATDVQAAIQEVRDESTSHFLLRKTAQEDVADDALQNDDHLSFAIGASEIWDVVIQGPCTLLASADFKFTFTGPTGMTFGSECLLYSAAALDGLVTVAGTAQASAQSVLFSVQKTNLYLHAYIVNSTSAGTVNFQWAMNTDVGGVNSLLIGVTLVGHKIA